MYYANSDVIQWQVAVAVAARAIIIIITISSSSSSNVSYKTTRKAGFPTNATRATHSTSLHAT